MLPVVQSHKFAKCIAKLLQPTFSHMVPDTFAARTDVNGVAIKETTTRVAVPDVDLPRVWVHSKQVTWLGQKFKQKVFN